MGLIDLLNNYYKDEGRKEGRKEKEKEGEEGRNSHIWRAGLGSRPLLGASQTLSTILKVFLFRFPSQTHGAQDLPLAWVLGCVVVHLPQVAQICM